MQRDDRIKRGQIYFVSAPDGSTPVGCEIWSDRPGLVVSNDVTNNTGGAIIIVYLSTSLKKRSSPLHVPVMSGGRPATALCEQLHSVDPSRLQNLIGTVTDKELATIDKTLCMSLAIDQQTYRGTFRKWANYIQEYHLEVNEEQESIRSAAVDKAIATLQRQISILEKERDGYRKLAEAKDEMLSGVRMEQIL